MILVAANRNFSTGRKSVKVNVTDEELSAFGEAHAPTTQGEAVARLMRWFTGLDWASRKAIMGEMPEDLAPDIARLVLERMAAGSDDEADAGDGAPPVKFPGAVPGARADERPRQAAKLPPVPRGKRQPVR